MLRELNTIDTVVVHCSDSPNGDAYTTIERIDEWHAARRFRRDPEVIRRDKPKLCHVGYHLVIHVDGTAHQGRYLEEVGEHCAEYNARSLGFCLVGRDQFTREQWSALDKAITDARWVIGRELRVVGHRAFNTKKTCPNFEVRDWLKAGRQPLPEHIFERRV